MDNSAPDRGMGEYIFQQLVDITQIRELLEAHHRLSGMACSLFDPDGNNLIAVGWQDICVQFHRVNPVSCTHCRESDAYIKKHLYDFERDYLEYRCKNGMIDVAMPLVIDGEHLATFFTGQFFYDDDRPDTKYFLQQAKTLGFDTAAYLDALERVPVFSREHIRGNMLFLRKMMNILAKHGLNNRKLAREMEERQRLENEVNASRDYLANVINTIADPIFVKDAERRLVLVNDAWCALVGCSREELPGKTDCDFFTKEQVDVFWEIDDQVLASGAPKNNEAQIADPSGQVRTIDTHKSLYVDPQGQRFVVGVIRDITERKLLEAALIASEREFRTLAENAPDNIARHDRQCRLVYLNPAMERTLAVDPALVLGRTPTESGWGDSNAVAEYEHHIRRVLASGEPNDMEIVMPQHSTGEFHTHLIRFVAERDLDGKVAGALAIGRDITSIKNAERELWDIRSRLSAIFMTIPDLVWMKDKEGVYLACNPALQKLFGATEAEIIGKTDHDFVGAELADRFIQKDREAVVAGTVCINEEEVTYAADGRRGLLEIRKMPVCGPGGLIMGVLGIARDITERKRAEELLRKSEQEFRTLAEIFPDVVVRYDRECRRIFTNPAYENKFGIPVDLAVHTTADTQWMEGFPVEEYKAKLLEVMENEIPARLFLEWPHPTDKRIICHSCHVVAEKDLEGRVVGCLVISRDITEQRGMEKELFMAKKMELIGQLSGGVAHEVRNPLNAILSITEALFKEKEIGGNPEYQPYIEHIRTQVNRLAKLMTDLLDLGKPIKQADIKAVPLYRLCADTLRLWDLTDTAKEHSVVFVCDPVVSDPWVDADSMRLQQVILNLLENAAHCSPKGEEIRLQIAETDGRTISLQVRDYGKGIPQEKIKRVFEPFFTLRRGGTGLGLTLVKHFIKNMGGEITIRNNESSPGCTVELILNIARTSTFEHETEYTSD